MSWFSPEVILAENIPQVLLIWNWHFLFSLFHSPLQKYPSGQANSLAWGKFKHCWILQIIMSILLGNLFKTNSCPTKCCSAAQAYWFCHLILLFSAVASLQKPACSTEALADAYNVSHAKRNLNFPFNTFLPTNCFPEQYSAKMSVSYDSFLNNERLEHICKCFVESE